MRLDRSWKSRRLNGGASAIAVMVSDVTGGRWTMLLSPAARARGALLSSSVETLAVDSREVSRDST